MKFEIKTETETIYIEDVSELRYNKKEKKVKYEISGYVISCTIENVLNVWRLEE